MLLCYVRTVATHNQPPPLTLTLDNIITSNSHGKNIRFLKHFLAKIFLNFHLSWKIFCEKVKMLMLCVNEIQLMVAYTRGHGPARLQWTGRHDWPGTTLSHPPCDQGAEVWSGKTVYRGQIEPPSQNKQRVFMVIVWHLPIKQKQTEQLRSRE